MSVSLRTERAEARDLLAKAGVASPDFDVDELLSWVLGVSRGQLVLRDSITVYEADTFRSLVRRRAAREPLQHLTGVAAFRHVDLQVGPGVFVPRPETELLAGWAIEAALAALDRGVKNPTVVDLCTGSGAIAKSVAHEVQAARVFAIELDPQAHAWASRNLRDTGVVLALGDMAGAFDELNGSVDVVVSNPPYIPLDAWESVAPEARDHDPHLALFSGTDGLDAMRVVAREAARLLKPGGVVGAEHADAQGPEGLDGGAPGVFLADTRWVEVRDHADLAGRPRFTTARLAR